jgi:predicted negative regulator of RcsB-dependent stress response
MRSMLKPKKLVLGVLILAVVVVPAWFYFQAHKRDSQTAREELLSHLPADSTSVVYVDFA